MDLLEGSDDERHHDAALEFPIVYASAKAGRASLCLLYTSDAADERSSVDLGGRRIIKKKIYITTSILQHT